MAAVVEGEGQLQHYLMRTQALVRAPTVQIVRMEHNGSSAPHLKGHISAICPCERLCIY